MLLSLLNAPSRSKRRILHGVNELHAPIGTIPEVAFNLVRQVMKRNHDLCDSMLFEQEDNVLHDRPVEHWRQGLGTVRGKGAKTGAFSTGHHDGFHRMTSLSVPYKCACDQHCSGAERYRYAGL